uniref:Uncharacterized protein n=1 Tax=Leersia perrieri TaxID=77586 RepID=A0A0D9V1F1_9ORYZ
MDLTIPTAHTTFTSPRDSRITTSGSEQQQRRPRMDGLAMDQQQARQRRPRKRDRPPTPRSEGIRAAPPPAEEEEGARDEDVDRFFALLEDVREMRELWRRNGGEARSADGKQRITGMEDDGGRKQQDQQQLWRPTFVMEDFAFELKGSSDREVQPEKAEDSAPNLDLSLSM